MCGRFTLRTPVKRVAEVFDLPSLADFPPHYNVAPTHSVAAVRWNADQQQRELVFLQWGLIPAWADDPAIGSRMINARSESASTKPAFRDAFRQRRCLVVADGFFEWRQAERGRQPYYITRRDERPFGFAGLWEHWSKGESPIETCTILTTDANDLLRPLHDRMPVIMAEKDFDAWLDPALQDPRRLAGMLRPAADDELTVRPVSFEVNSVQNDTPRCIEQVAPQEQTTLWQGHRRQVALPGI